MRGDELTPYLRKFNRKFRHTDDKIIDIFDQSFYTTIYGYIDRIAKEEELTEKQKQKFTDMLYKVVFVKGEFDERYDNVLVYDMLKRLGKRN